MQPRTKCYLSITVALVIGAIIGAVAVGYGFYAFKDQLCVSSEAQKVQVLNTAPSQSQIQRATSLETNPLLFGKVLSVTANDIVLAVTVGSALNSDISTTTSVAVPFDNQTDSVMLLKQSTTSATVTPVNGSLSDVKVGSSVWIMSSGGKKTVYIQLGQ